MHCGNKGNIAVPSHDVRMCGVCPTLHSAVIYTPAPYVIDPEGAGPTADVLASYPLEGKREPGEKVPEMRKTRLISVPVSPGDVA